jgi:hypothetical protein
MDARLGRGAAYARVAPDRARLSDANGGQRPGSGCPQRRRVAADAAYTDRGRMAGSGPGCH